MRMIIQCYYASVLGKIVGEERSVEYTAKAGFDAWDSLTKEEIREIAALQIRELVCQAAQSGLSLDVDSSVAGWVAEKGYSHAYGARPIRRVIQKEIEDPLSMMLIGTQLAAGDTLQVTVGEQGLQFDKKEV